MRKPYPDDLTDEEWARIEPILKRNLYRGAGTHPKYPRREILNAVFYILRTGCRWRDLPHDFPPWKSVYAQFLRWKRKGVFSELHDTVRSSLRKVLGRSDIATAGIVDSQSVKTTEKKGSADSMEVKKLKVGKDTFWLITLDS